MQEHRRDGRSDSALTSEKRAGGDRQLVMLGRSFSVGRLQMMRTIVLPGAVPSIIAGLRLGLGQGLIGVYVAELTAATAGIGFSMNQAGLDFQTDLGVRDALHHRGLRRHLQQ